MKKCKVIMIAFLVIFLAGCSQSRQQDIIVDMEELQAYDYQEVESPEHDIKISECEFSIPEHSQVDAFYVYDNTVYYSVGFSDYLQNNTGSHFVEFKEKYNTQIRSFNMKSKEDSLLYQYKEDNCINIADIACNGTYLIWEDYQIDGWRIQKLSLTEDESPEIIVDNGAHEFGTLWTITPVITEDSLYWYDKSDELDNPVTLYRYDFKTKKTDIFQSGLSTPYTHVSIVNGICTFFEKEDKDKTIIYIYNLAKKELTTLTVPMEVRDPISNGEICIWLKGWDYYDTEMLYVYNLLEGSFEQIDVSHAFSYGILGEYIIVNRHDYDSYRNDELFCYDVKSKTYFPITSSENVSYGFTRHGLPDNIYADKWIYNKENSKEIISLSLY
ncbi:MAG: hypothetical protein K2N34_08860 [Lachnospiraceae bacterium]|nr:hypothetical protein [Lachnospiraceae bacterium]